MEYNNGICALNKSNTLICSYTEILAQLSIIDFSLFNNVICVVATSNIVYCLNSNVVMTLPTQFSSGATKIFVGDNIMCTLTIASNANCFVYSTTFAIPQVIDKVSTIGVGSKHICILDSNNSVTCYGSNIYNQLNIPSALSSNVKDLSTFGNTNCVVLISGIVGCWGG